MDQTGKKMSLGIEKMFAEIYKSGNLKEVNQDNISGDIWSEVIAS